MHDDAALALGAVMARAWSKACDNESILPDELEDWMISEGLVVRVPLKGGYPGQTVAVLSDLGAAALPSTGRPRFPEEPHGS